MAGLGGCNCPKFLAAGRESGQPADVIQDAALATVAIRLPVAGWGHMSKGARVEYVLKRGLKPAESSGGHIQEELRSVRSHRTCRLFAARPPVRRPAQHGFRV